MRKPTIAITMGDAAGIGPEIVVKSLADPRVQQWCDPVVLGDLRVIVRGGLIETKILRSLHQTESRVEGAAHLPPRLVIGPEPGQIDVGVSGDEQFPFLQVALLQLVELREQRVMGLDDALALVLVEWGRRADVRQVPD